MQLGRAVVVWVCVWRLLFFCCFVFYPDDKFTWFTYTSATWTTHNTWNNKDNNKNIETLTHTVIEFLFFFKSHTQGGCQVNRKKLLMWKRKRAGVSWTQKKRHANTNSQREREDTQDEASSSFSSNLKRKEDVSRWPAACKHSHTLTAHCTAHTKPIVCLLLWDDEEERVGD